MNKLLFIIIIALFVTTGIQAQSETKSPTTWSNQYYAPYVYATGYPISYLAQSAGTKYLTLAFILASPNKCQAAWGGSTQIDQQPLLLSELEKLRATGGDVIISFGGAGGTELARICTDVESLAAQYQSVIDTYNVTSLDFDIEGEAIRDSDSIDRRSQALALLQSRANAAGNNLRITFTLPVLPTGLTDDGQAVLQSAVDNGVQIDLVNIMTMDFGADYPPDKMGELTIQSADSLFKQLSGMFPNKTDAELWSMIGLTPMIGLNDTVPEEFTLSDAQLVADYSKEKGIGQIAVWSLLRDKACSSDAKLVSETCSGVSQDKYAYSAILNPNKPAG